MTDFKVGDRVLVTSNLTAFWGKKGVVESVTAKSAFGINVRIDGFTHRDDFPTPFNPSELMLEPQTERPPDTDTNADGPWIG